MSKTDSQIQQDVIRELQWDPRVEETEVGVQVDRGVVTLTGRIGSWAKRVAAEQAAHRVAGVLDVANDLDVSFPSGRTDNEIAHAVRHALEWDVFVPHERIRSTVANGLVTLEGQLDHPSESEDAERAIQNLAGVRGVTNRITVARRRVDPERIRGALEQALERRAEREAKRIQVDVVDGTVTLSGQVRSWPERHAAVSAVRYAPGVLAVEDNLEVNPDL